MKYGELNLGQIEAIVNKIGGMEGVEALLRGELVVTSTENIVSYPITIDYEQSLEEMVKAGAYDWKNSDITSEHFPIDGNGTVERTTELVHFNRSISTDDALAELDKQGFRPATIEERVMLARRSLASADGARTSREITVRYPRRT